MNDNVKLSVTFGNIRGQYEITPDDWIKLVAEDTIKYKQHSVVTSSYTYDMKEAYGVGHNGGPEFLTNEKELLKATEAISTPGGGVKFDSGKPPMSLIPYSVMEQVAKVLGFGANKYGPNNWRQGMAWSRLISAAERHLGAFKDGTNLDEESGLNHLDHALCCLIFLRWYADNRQSFDDRYVPGAL